MTGRISRARNGLLAGALAVAALAGAGCRDGAAEVAAAEERAALKTEIDRLRKDADKASDDLKRARADLTQHGIEIGALAERVKAVEERPAAAAGTAPATAVPSAPSEADKKARSDELDALRKKVFDGTATEEEEERFWELARSTGHIDEMLKTLEAAVKEKPADIEARMNLAEGYIAKLMTVPDGQKGVLSMKAEQQWKKVLELDPDHWDARFSMAFGWTFWPEQFNRTPDAIREFEKVREVQERHAPDEKHGQTYVQLSRLYLKQGKTEKARETLRAGLARHPGDAEITKSLDSMQE